MSERLERSWRGWGTLGHNAVTSDEVGEGRAGLVAHGRWRRVEEESAVARSNMVEVLGAVPRGGA